MKRRIIIINGSTSLPNGMCIKHAQNLPSRPVLMEIKSCGSEYHTYYIVFASRSECYWAHRAIRCDTSPINPIRNEEFMKVGELIPHCGTSGKYKGHNFYRGNKCYPESHFGYILHSTSRNQTIGKVKMN